MSGKNAEKGRRWSRRVELHEGALERLGWKEHESTEERHRALERSVREDGYRTTVDRLGFMENVANRENNRGLRETAHTDLDWLQRWERVDEDDEDRRRELGTHHRVRGFDREVEGHRERVRSHLARNPRKR